MNIFMWSGPRNISTALMRSFENRTDTYVWDEPFYAYYLYKTKNNHPLKEEIINKYPYNEKEIIDKISLPPPKNKYIHYQKHMTHHILEETSLDWLSKGINCFLIRDPAEVINSYIKKNKLKSALDLGFPNQLKLFEKVKFLNKKLIVINSNDLLINPKKILTKLCLKINIPFEKNMLHWSKGLRETDGIWSSIWYDKVIKSTGFNNYYKQKIIIPKRFLKIYKECLLIYNIMSKYKI